MTGIWEWLKGQFEPRDSAWVVLYDKKGLYLGRRGKTVKRPGEWNFIGGGIDGGEQPMECALRELREEIGLKVDASQLQPLGRISGFHFFAFKVKDHHKLHTSREIDRVQHFHWHEYPNPLHHKTKVFVDHWGRSIKQKILAP